MTELAIDARWLKTGIGRYTQSLLHGLRDSLPEVRLTCIAHSRDAGRMAAFADHVATCDAGIYGVREQLAMLWLARKVPALYVPHYNIPVLWRGRLLVTIHDLNHLLDRAYRGTWRSRLYAWPILRKAVEKADVIVTPSEYTRSRISETLGVHPSRIRVIPCCVAPCFTLREKAESRARVSQECGISKPFLLFVGNCAPNKNLELLLTAYARLRDRRADAPLLVVAGGQGQWEPKVRHQVEALHLQKEIVWLDKPADPMLAELYSAALMTVVPSFEEGFGLPVIESMACGTPVLCSQAASLPEVAGEAALYFSPYSSEELAVSMEDLMDSSAMQERLIRMGLERAAQFSHKEFRERQASAIRVLLPN